MRCARMLGTEKTFLWTNVLFGVVIICHAAPHDPYGFVFRSWGSSATVTSMKDGKIEDNGQFVVDFGQSVGLPKACDDETKEDVLCAQWFSSNEQAASKIRIQKKENPSKFPLFTVSISQGNKDTKVSVCFDHEGQNLYGGNVDNNYPSQNIVKEEAAFVTGEGDSKTPSKWVGWVAEKKWLTSGGRAIHVKPGSPLFVSQNATKLCLILKNESPYPKSAQLHMEYDLCITKNVKEAWLCQNPHLKKPLPKGFEYILREPIWSTWVAYKKDISQQIVMDFANTIKKNQLRLGTMEIDEKWETCFGSQKFDTQKFPDAKKLIKDLQSLGARVTFWIQPFVNKECEEFKELGDHLFKVDNGTTTGTTIWWEGEAGMFNFLKKDTYDFFKTRLSALKNTYGMDGFKFDAGEAYYIPKLFEETPFADPNQFTTTYLKLVESFGPNSEVRTGADSSDLQLLQRLQDTNSNWSLKNFGLKSVISSVLQLSILGYKTILPDMIGGNVYGPPPNKELFIRWVQLTTFLPVMQFSYHPWTFDQETVNITRDYVNLHYKFSDQMIAIHNNPEQPPLITPVWWLDPEMPEAQQIMDEFLVGDQILVAPVVEEGARNRTIFFPSGVWVDVNGGLKFVGPLTVPDFPAPLERLPFFLREPISNVL